jgi:hypothetical protein
MELQNTLKATGKVRIVKTNSAGEVVQDFEVPNLVVTTGKNFIAGSMIKTTTNSPAAMTYMGVGTSGTTPGATDTALLGQTARVTLSASVTNNAVTYTATFPAGTGDGALQEAGIFNASTAGTMLCRTTFSTVTKGSGDTVAITWVVTVS